MVTCAAAGPPVGLLPPAGLAKAAVDRAVTVNRTAVSCILTNLTAFVDKAKMLVMWGSKQMSSCASCKT